MVSATMDPLAQTEEKWKVETPTTFLVVFVMVKRTCLYLVRDLTPDETKSLLAMHNQFAKSANVRLAVAIRGFPGRFAGKLFYDTASEGEPPVAPPDARIILTGE